MDSTNLDLNRDGVIDQKDVNILTSRMSQAARQNDPMDMDGDGKITARDVQLFRTQCTSPGCAVNAVKSRSHAGVAGGTLHAGPVGWAGESILARGIRSCGLPHLPHRERAQPDDRPSGRSGGRKSYLGIERAAGLRACV